MCIAQIRLEHFRCYDNLTLNLKPGINLLIGDNSSGKTTILKACRYVLGAFFTGYSDENTAWKTPTNDDFTQCIIGGVIQPEQPLSISFWPSDDSIAGAPFVIQKRSKKNGRPLMSGLAPYRDYGRDMLRGDKPLPLFAAFSTEDIHTRRNISWEGFKNSLQKASFGYYECLSCDGFLPYWLKRLLVLQEDRQEKEVKAVHGAIVKAMGKEGCGIIDGMEVRHNQGKVYYQLSDGRNVAAEQLSDGFRRIVSIVTDLAFRSVLLNGRYYGEEAARGTTGTVLIDEIDMHLHPVLQSRVLRGLTNAFPNLQFIVTTHAPMVMSSVENNEQNIVYHLTYDGATYGVRSDRTYGMDVSAITQCVLRQTPRAEAVEEELQQLFHCIDEAQYDEAVKHLEDLRNRFGEALPELSRADTMIRFLQTNACDETDN